MRSRMTLLLTLGLVWPCCASAAEVQLRARCEVEPGLVLLGDIAEVLAADDTQKAQLAELDLLPAPAPNTKRVLRLREIEDLLVLRGVNLGQLRFSGASSVVITTAQLTQQITEPAAPKVPMGNAKELHRKVHDALVACLSAQWPEAEEAQIAFELSPEAMEQIAGAKSIVAQGGAAPWIGEQQFSVGSENDGLRVPVAVTVTPPPSFIVAANPLGPGEIIQASDVRLQPGRPGTGKVHTFQDIAAVVGKETTRMIAPGQLLDDQSLRRPVLVRRGEIVTVHSGAAGVHVRTTARAKQQGAAGDVISVETVNERTAYLTRVRGPQEVEVCSPGTETTQPTPQQQAAR